jgi:hypothetical protein
MRDSQRSKVNAVRAAMEILHPGPLFVPTARLSTETVIERWLHKQLCRQALVNRYSDYTRSPMGVLPSPYWCSWVSDTGTVWGFTVRTRGGPPTAVDVLLQVAKVMVNRVNRMGDNLAAGLRGDHALHSWQVAYVYLDLVRFILGKEAGDDLKRLFKEHKVRFRPKKKVTPSAKQLAGLYRARKAKDKPLIEERWEQFKKTGRRRVLDV